MSGDSKRSDGIESISNAQLDSTLFDIEERYRNSSTPKELQQLIEHVDRETFRLDNEMKQFVKLKLKKHDQELSSLEFKRATKLAGTIANSNDLNQVFQTANDLGHSLTLKIKSLDLEIASVNHTLEFVQNIQILKTNINKAHYALEHGDLEVTARCIHLINTTIPSELINGKYASVVIPSTDIPELPETILAKWSSDLTKVFTTKFNEASKQRNVPELTKYFQLFPLIKQSETGLNHYSKFICDIISETLNHLIGSTSSVNPSDLKSGVFSNLTILLFESIATMLSQHESLIKRYYSQSFPNCMPYVIARIQDEIDSQIGVISDTFYDLRRIDKLYQDIQLYKFPILSKRREEQTNEPLTGSGLANDSHPQFHDDEVISIVQVGDLINELATIFHHWSLYSKFISARYLQDTDQLKKTTPNLNDSVAKLGHRRAESNGNGKGHYDLKLPQLIIDSNFTRKINQKLLPTFEMLYKFYFRRSLEKSIMIEELPSLDPYLQLINNNSPTSLTGDNDEHSPCSSVIEDVTLILNTTLRNIIQTSLLSTVKTFVTGISKILQNDLINGYFIRNLNNNLPRYNQTLSLISASSNSGISRAASPVTRSATPEVNGGMSFFKGASNALGNVVGTTSATTNLVAGGLRTGTNNPKLVNFVIHLNTVSLGQEYFSKIITNMKASNLIPSAFPFSGDADKVETWLQEDLLDPFISITNKILNDSLINLYNQSLKNRLLIMVSELIPDVSETYLIHSNEDINDNQALFRFGLSWQSLITPLKQSVHGPLFEKLMRLVVVNVVNLLEKRLHLILKKFRINEMGSVRLEKDISYFINEVCDDNYQLREKFVRITQLVLLVDMDDEEYEESLRHANQAKTGDSIEGAQNDDDENDDEYHLGINWVLTPSERKQIRSYRI